MEQGDEGEAQNAMTPSPGDLELTMEHSVLNEYGVIGSLLLDASLMPGGVGVDGGRLFHSFRCVRYSRAHAAAVCREWDPLTP